MDIERERLVRAMEERYHFPCFYPVVVIARNETAFAQRLEAALVYEQDGDEYTITQRPSSQHNYISYRIEMFVQSAEIALRRKEFLRNVEGVMVLL